MSEWKVLTVDGRVKGTVYGDNSRVALMEAQRKGLLTHPRDFVREVVDGAWHVAAVLRGTGRRRFNDERDFVFYVQRYVKPQEGRTYTGDVATRTWPTEAEAQRAADLANEGRYDFNIRGTYL